MNCFWKLLIVNEVSGRTDDEPIGLLAVHFGEVLKMVECEMEKRDSIGEVMGVLVWIV